VAETGVVSDTGIDRELVDEVFRRVTGDLSMIIDKTFSAASATVERVGNRPAGGGCNHISFKFAFRCEDETMQGCILVPLPAAVALAGYLMMYEVEPGDGLDQETKGSMLELSNFAANAAEAAFKNVGLRVEVRTKGCQGVRADVRPALVYEDGDELLVGRVQADLEGAQSFEMLLLVPVQAVLEPAAA